MSTRSEQLVLRARDELIEDLGYEPTLTAVAKCASVSIPTIRLVYAHNSLNTRAGQGAEALQRVNRARAKLLSTLGREPTQVEVRELTGLSTASVSKAYAKLGLSREGQHAKRRAVMAAVRNAMRRARVDLRAELRHEPSQSEIARRLGISKQRVSQIVRETKSA